MARMGAGVYKWVRMGAVGRRDTGGTKNKRNGGLNGRKGHLLARMITATKNQEVGRGGHGGQRGSFGGMEGKE